MDTTPVSAVEFYKEYHGHPLKDLQTVVAQLRHRSSGIVWFAGDSSLDNKHWLFQGSDKGNPQHYENTDLVADAINGYEDILTPPKMVRDIAYWLNKEFATSQSGLCCVNTAVEESTLADRDGRLKPHDMIIQEHLSKNDVIVVSAGGNDVALKPSPLTQQNLMRLFMSTEGTQEHDRALDHFVQIFKNKTEAYVQRLATKSQPRLVVVCMLYYLDETPGHGWCESMLAAMQYNTSPEILQKLLQSVYRKATERIEIPNMHVIPLPLFTVLDGKDTTDYCERVEPSVTGGRKMAKLIADVIARG